MTRILLRIAPRVLRAARPVASAALSTLGTYFMVKTAAKATVNTVGAGILSQLRNSLPFTIAVAAFAFIFFASFLGKEILLNKKVSAIIFAAFIAVIATSTPAMRALKTTVYSPSRVIAEQFSKGKKTVTEATEFLGATSDVGVYELAVKLIKNSSSAETKLLKAIVKKNKAFFRKTETKKRLTPIVLEYGSVEVFNLLNKQGFLNIPNEINYKKRFLIGHAALWRTPRKFTREEIDKLRKKLALDQELKEKQ
jgi:hypothetical protein